MIAKAGFAAKPLASRHSRTWGYVLTCVLACLRACLPTYLLTLACLLTCLLTCLLAYLFTYTCLLACLLACLPTYLGSREPFLPPLNSAMYRVPRPGVSSFASRGTHPRKGGVSPMCEGMDSSLAQGHGEFMGSYMGREGEISPTLYV